MKLILNSVEIEIFASIELVDAYNNKIPDNFINDNVIYCVHNKINNKNYIGQTINFRNRFSDSYIGHFKDYHKYLNGNLGDRRILYKAWKKYGLESFVIYIIDICDGRTSLNEREIFWIKELHTCTKDPECLGYNLSWGADDMGVKDEISIKKSLSTRMERYGSYVSPACHTPEALAKGNQTKIERYGHGGFINAFTPEANEKRVQTNLKRYGTPHGPKMSQEAIDKMVAEKIEKYGDPMGICNTPENRAKAKLNMQKTNLLNSINSNINKSNSPITNIEDYIDLVFNLYSTIRGGVHHLEGVISILPELKKDDRWNSMLESIFQIPNDMYSLIKAKKDIHQRESFLESIKRNHTYEKKFLRNLIKNVEKANISTWNEFLLFTKDLFGRRKGRRIDYLNKIIDNLPIIKTLPEWTPKLEEIFGSLTEEDKL